MSAFINVEIEADTVISAMLEDGEFASEMWTEIGKGLHQGRLLDDAMDIIKEFQTEKIQQILNGFDLMTKTLKDHLDHNQGEGEDENHS